MAYPTIKQINKHTNSFLSRFSSSFSFLQTNFHGGIIRFLLLLPATTAAGRHEAYLYGLQYPHGVYPCSMSFSREPVYSLRFDSLI